MGRARLLVAPLCAVASGLPTGKFMRKETFLEYIIAHSRDRSPIGDFCEDTLRLIRMGKRPSSYTLRGVIKFIEGQYGCQEAVEACKEAWAEWKSVI